jgi:hypothetical protein
LTKVDFCNVTHLSTHTSVSIFVKGWGGYLLTLGTDDCVENYAPLRNIDRRVLKEVVEENLDSMFTSKKRGRETAYVVKF